jgi:hypothetical protein
MLPIITFCPHITVANSVPWCSAHACVACVSGGSCRRWKRSVQALAHDQFGGRPGLAAVEGVTHVREDRISLCVRAHG